MQLLGFIFFILIGIAQMYAGYIGIEYHFGLVWALVALAASLLFRFSLPISIGAFFGAMDVWGWHWALSLLFVAPGLAFVVPGFVLSLFDRPKS